MRIRVCSRPPLPTFKAWYSLPTMTRSISELKAELCATIPALRDEADAPHDLTLSVDDFDLLDDGLADVLRENDLVCIARAAVVSSNAGGLKRKRRDSQDIHVSRLSPIEKRTRLPSSSSSSSTSDSDSSSDTDESSDSSSASSSSCSGSLVSVQRSKLIAKEIALGAAKSQTRNLSASFLNRQQAPTNAVPPGGGNARTRSRNARRRLKRIHEKEEAAAQSIVNGNSVNATPLGVRPSNPPVESVMSLNQSEVVVDVDNNPVQNMSTSLKNKNKKRGFKKAMEGSIPQRIIFTENSTLSSAPFQVDETDSILASVSQTSRPRLVTPLEKQDLGLLPANMFVTSVELEGGRKLGWDRKKKKKMRDAYEGEQRVEDVIDDVVELNYGEDDGAAEAVNSDIQPGTGSSQVDWDSVEKSWDGFELVQVDENGAFSVHVGDILGWKALGMNPETSTPELLIHLARVKSTDVASRELIISPILRPGAANLTFGAIPIDVKVEGGQTDEGCEDESVHIADTVKDGWKIVV